MLSSRIFSVTSCALTIYWAALRKICKEQLANTQTRLANAKAAADKPFPQEDELKTKSACLDELNILLNMDKRENEIADWERDGGSEIFG